MKSTTRILLAVLALTPACVHAAGPLSGTAGGNLTAYNPGGGILNNNEWNSMMNSRSSGANSAAPTADFGNCNSVILRCASPKCASGGCTTMEIATPIVAGCVAANDACRQYGDDLVQAIAAQLVANSTAKANAQAAAATEAAAAQTAQQMQAMQAQMQQMQESMAAQNAEQIAQLQSALEEQKELTAQAIAEANESRAAAAAATPAPTSAGGNGAATTATDATTAPTTVIEGLTEAQKIAAASGVSADILAREQVAGQIETYLEAARVQLNNAKKAMDIAFNYGKCSTNGDNCEGPKRVSVFRQKAMDFFEPYDAVLDNVYDALILAQSVGIDITDIYMMLNDSCNVWGEYLCYGGMTTKYAIRKDDAGNPVIIDGKNQYDTVSTWPTYTGTNCVNGKSKVSNDTKGGIPCTPGAVIPPEDSPACTLNRTLVNMEQVQRNFLFSDSGYADEHIRVGCASSALESSKFFRNRKKGASIDVEILERIISQDAPSMFGTNRFGTGLDVTVDGPKYCAVNPTSYMELQKAASLKTLPSRICVTDSALANTFKSNGAITSVMTGRYSKKYADEHPTGAMEESDPKYKDRSTCEGKWGKWENNKCECDTYWLAGICMQV